MHAIMTDFIIWGRLTRAWGPFGALGTALTRNVEDHMARRTCFREQYYTGMRGYKNTQEKYMYDLVGLLSIALD